MKGTKTQPKKSKKAKGDDFVKKIISAVLSLTIIIGTFPMISAFAENTQENGWNGTTATLYSGEGTTSSPYLITNAAELAYLRNQVNDLNVSGTTYSRKNDFNGKIFSVTADIDLNGKEWTPIGRQPNVGFRGTINGNGHVIKNFNITKVDDSTGVHIGFFGHLDGATVNKLGIENVTVNTTASNKQPSATGIMVGRGTGKFTDCYVKNSSISVKNGRVAGFTGQLRSSSTYENCYVYNCDITTSATSTAAFTVIENYKNYTNVFKNCYTAKVTNSNDNYCAFILAEHQSSDPVTPKEPTLTNCLSDVSRNKKGLAGNQKVYGDYGATKKAIVDLMTSNGYSVSSKVNNGYPCLGYECAWDGVSTESYEGRGTESSPYIIDTAAKLAKARDDINADYKSNGVSTECFKLTADIDLGGNEWVPIGTNAKAYYLVDNAVRGTENDFRGTFDGNKHVIKNFKITKKHTITLPSTETLYKDTNKSATITSLDISHPALFGHVSNATIKNLGVENVTIEKLSNAGGMIGRGTLKLCENCYVKGLEYTTNDRWHNIGGFIGTVRGTSEFTNCYVYNAKLKAGGGASVGGFASSLENANARYTFNNCYTANLTMENSSTGERAAFYPFVNNKRIYNYQIAQGDSATGTFGANWKNVTITADSCYAEQNGANGEMQGNYDTPTFTAAASYGTLNKSVSEINSALVSNAENCQFRTTASLNGGFPALKWEKEPEVNAYTVRTVAVDEDDKINVTLSENVKTDGAKVYVAAYTYDGRLENAYSANVTTDEVKTNVLTNNNATQVRVYVWDSNLNPIAETYTAKCRDGLLTEVVKRKTDVDTPEDEPTEEKISVFMVGDSIMDDVGRTGCSYATQGDEWCKRGWEGFIGNYLKSDKVSVIPHGHNGRTVEYLMKGINAADNCSWESIKRKLYPGDFIILGLGTNDNARLSPNGTIKNGVTEKYTQEQFVAWYKTIINDATAKGAKVILTKPLPTQNQIDNDGKFVTTSTQTYAVAAIDKVVEETGVACVDLSTLCATAFNAYAVEKGLQPADLRVTYETANGVTTAKTPGKILVDYCHLTGEAADITAKTFATAIKGMNTELEKYLNF